MNAKAKRIDLTINGTKCRVPADQTILNTCLELGIKIPTLCYMEDVCQRGACSICLVEVIGAKALMRACVTKIRPDMVINTNNERVRKARRVILELLLANHPADCLACDKNQKCELQQLAQDLGIEEIRFRKTRKKISQSITLHLQLSVIPTNVSSVDAVLKSAKKSKQSRRSISQDVGCTLRSQLSLTKVWAKSIA